MARKQTDEKVYPDRTLEDAARAGGAKVVVCWEIPGPRLTAISWMVGYIIQNTLVIVQTLEDGGWHPLVEMGSIYSDETLRQVFERCCVYPRAAA